MDTYQRSISSRDLGDKWPLTVDSGVVEHHGDGSVVFVADDVTYALNGTAKGTGRYADLAPIWADSADAGLKKSLAGLIDAGRSLGQHD